MLYIVSTPIGNLEDITLRALKVLRESDYILCEDTRVSKKLLHHFSIDTPLYSFHKFNESEKKRGVLEDLKNGKALSLISDAGTPLINDPGMDLIQAVLEEGLEITALPGATSVINALILSGVGAKKFQFAGFLPKTGKESWMRRLLCYSGTSIAFESPHRIKDTILLIEKIDPKRRIVILREMTKMFEERISGTPDEVLQKLENPKGEIVLVIEENDLSFEGDLSEVLQILQEEHGMSLKEAIKAAAQIVKKPKKDVYHYALTQYRSE